MDATNKIQAQSLLYAVIVPLSDKWLNRYWMYLHFTLHPSLALFGQSGPLWFRAAHNTTYINHPYILPDSLSIESIYQSNSSKWHQK